MRFSLSFISEFFSPPMSASALAKALTMAGMEVERLERKGEDWLFDIEVTSNRYDWLSMAGIAREIAAICGERLTIETPRIKKGPRYKQPQIIIEDLGDCPFYIGRIIKHIKVGKAPAWLRQRLLRCGVKTVNNIVDITNYCMLKWGNPLHAFDRDKIEGNVYIRRARKGEIFLGLDDKERVLSEENLVIADERKIIALAGVMGAKNTEVTPETTSVFLEGAIFSPLAVRRSRRYAGIETESSYRFERRVSGEYLEIASDEAERLMVHLGKAESAGYAEAGRRPRVTPKRIKVSFTRLNAYLGETIPRGTAKKILRNLGFSTKDTPADSIAVVAPSFRFDIQQDVDIFEEVARIYGYDRIKAAPLFIKPILLGEGLYHFKQRLRNFLIALGYQEIITYSITSHQKQTLRPGEKAIALLNPLRKQEDSMRTTLLWGMLEAATHNVNQQSRALFLFEIANTYCHQEHSFVEKPSLALGTNASSGGLYLKGAVEAVLRLLNIVGYTFGEAPGEGFSSSVEIFVHDKKIGYLGKVAKKTQDAFQLRGEFYFAQLDINMLQRAERERRYQRFSRQPFIYRDLSIALSKDKKFKDIEEDLRAEAVSHLQRYEVIDIYRGKGIPEGFTGFTLRIYYQAKDRTLVSEEVDRGHNVLRERLSQREGVLVR